MKYENQSDIHTSGATRINYLVSDFSRFIVHPIEFATGFIQREYGCQVYTRETNIFNFLTAG